MKRTKSRLVIVPPVSEPERCFTRLEPELAGLAKLRPVRSNVPELVVRLLATLPGLQELRQDLVRCFKVFDVRRLDTLADYAWCLLHTDCLYRAAITVPRNENGLLREALELRYFLRKKAKLIDPDLDAPGLSQLRGTRRYDAVAADLELLHAWLSERKELCVVPTRRMLRASSIVPSLRRIATAHDPKSELAVAAHERRARAYTLLYGVYQEIRRSIIFLRHDTRDGDEIAPKLFAEPKAKQVFAAPIPINRPRRRKATTAEASSDEQPQLEVERDLPPETTKPN
jgi:hypothetical protein